MAIIRISIYIRSKYSYKRVVRRKERRLAVCCVPLFGTPLEMLTKHSVMVCIDKVTDNSTPVAIDCIIRFE